MSEGQSLTSNKFGELISFNTGKYFIYISDKWITFQDQVLDRIYQYKRDSMDYLVKSFLEERASDIKSKSDLKRDEIIFLSCIRGDDINLTSEEMSELKRVWLIVTPYPASLADLIIEKDLMKGEKKDNDWEKAYR